MNTTAVITNLEKMMETRHLTAPDAEALTEALAYMKQKERAETDYLVGRAFWTFVMREGECWGGYGLLLDSIYEYTQSGHRVEELLAILRRGP